MAGKNGGRSFLVSGVSYLRKSGNNDVLKELVQEYECVIIDFGEREPEHEKMFFMCDRSFLVGSLSEWQLDDFASVIISGQYLGGKAEYFSSFGDRESVKLMQKRLGIRITEIPWNMNPFNINSGVLQFFSGFLT